MKQNRVWTKQEAKELDWWGTTFLRQCELLPPLRVIRERTVIQ